jgi:hypothetical protein
LTGSKATQPIDKKYDDEIKKKMIKLTGKNLLIQLLA